MTVVYGLRYRVVDDDEHLEDEELEPYELETEPRMVRARQAGLDCWWGRDCDGGAYYLLIGKILVRVGAEHDLHAQLTDAALARCREDVRRRLADAGFPGEASLHLQAWLR
jgi:hypothetical protein